MDEVAANISNDSHATILSGPIVTTIDGNAGRSGEVTRWPTTALDRAGYNTANSEAGPDDPPRLNGADSEDGCLWAICGDRETRRGRGEESISFQVAVLVDDLLDMVTVGGRKFMSPIIKTHPVLCPTAGYGEFVRVRVKG